MEQTYVPEYELLLLRRKIALLLSRGAQSRSVKTPLYPVVGGVRFASEMRQSPVVIPLYSLDFSDDELLTLRHLQFFSTKSQIIVLNVHEHGLQAGKENLLEEVSDIQLENVDMVS